MPDEGAQPGGGKRRRRRRGRGRRPEAVVQGAADVRSVEVPTRPPQEHSPRKRRRRGRGRRGPAAVETAPGEVPADYIPLQVERGMPVLYEAREAVEEAQEEPAKPQKAKRVNSGKLFWYIRSKSYVPIPELRRRFEIGPDEMGVIQDDGQKLYIGLPQEVADMVANLRRQQKIGIECSADFEASVVIGVYPLYPASGGPR